MFTAWLKMLYFHRLPVILYLRSRFVVIVIFVPVEAVLDSAGSDYFRLHLFGIHVAVLLASLYQVYTAQVYYHEYLVMQ